jgi:hypothetical protein
MDESACYRIRVKGHLSEQWADWFDGLTLENLSNGCAELSGMLPDQSALYGVLNRIRDIGLTLISVNRVEETECSDASGLSHKKNSSN